MPHDMDHAVQGAHQPLASDNQPGLPCRFHCTVDYKTADDALAVCKCLSADPELRPDQVGIISTSLTSDVHQPSSQVTKHLAASGTVLHINFAAADLRTLRAAVGTFLDLLALATRTIETFPRVDRSC